MPLFRSRATLVASIVAGAFFMENLDGAAITIVLPQIADTFGVTAAAASLGITVYMITLAIFIPMSGWAADRYGPRNVFCGAIAVFTLASIACGLSPTQWHFVAARMAQGAAGAFMSPVGRIVVLRTAQKHELVRAFGMTVWPALIAPILGQPVSGLISTYASWQWIFFLNVPLGILGILLVLAFVDNRKEPVARPLDVLGLALTAASLSSLLYGCDRLARPQSAGWSTAGLLVAGALLGAVAILHARRHEHPILDLKLAKVHNFAVTSIWGGTFFRVSMGAAPFLLPLLFQIGFGMSALDASLLMIAYAVGNLIMKSATTAILRRFGFRQVLVVNGVAVVLSIAAFAFLSPGAPWIATLSVLFLAGFVRSLQFTALNTLAFADIPQSRMGDASAMQAMMQQIAFAFGVAFGAIALSASATFRDGAGGATTVADFQVAFLSVAVMALISLVWLLRLARDAGDEVSGYVISSAKR